MDPEEKRHMLIMQVATLVTAMYAFIMSRRIGQPYRYRIGYGLMWGYRVCKHALREESPFFKICSLLRERNLLRDNIHSCVEEQVAIFFFMWLATTNVLD